MTRRRFITLAGAMPGYVLVPTLLRADGPAAAPALTVGDFKKIYDPTDPGQPAWYINDHTFIRAEDGTWHLFGITHAEPAKPMEEKFLAHATAPDLLGPWTKQAPVLDFDASQGETLVWAPYALYSDGLYYLFYCGGGPDHTKYRIDVASSKDLFTWERSPANPLLVDGYDARDPMVLKVADTWILYYCATTTPKGGNHTVKAVTSQDLLHWSDPREVFSSPATGTYGGPTESPFVVYREGKYYLFLCTNVGYNQTTVYASDSAFHWEPAAQVGQFPAHAAEVVQTPEGKWYVSRAGWGQGGVYLAEMSWKV